MNKLNIMLDLETMGTSNNAAIVSIGATAFVDFKIIDTFYKPIWLSSSVESGLEMNASTVEWWINQSKESKEVFNDPNRCTLYSALASLQTWIYNLSEHGKPDKVWGNGSTFDNIIIRNAFNKCDLQCPWHYRADSCFRTICKLAKYFNLDEDVERKGTHHNALDDAVYQTEVLMSILKQLRK